MAARAKERLKRAFIGVGTGSRPAREEPSAGPRTVPLHGTPRRHGQRRFHPPAQPVDLPARLHLAQVRTIPPRHAFAPRETHGIRRRIIGKIDVILAEPTLPRTRMPPPALPGRPAPRSRFHSDRPFHRPVKSTDRSRHPLHRHTLPGHSTFTHPLPQPHPMPPIPVPLTRPSFSFFPAASEPHWPSNQHPPTSNQLRFSASQPLSLTGPATNNRQPATNFASPLLPSAPFPRGTDLPITP